MELLSNGMTGPVPIRARATLPGKSKGRLMKGLRTTLLVALTACLAFEPVTSRAAGDDGRSRAIGGGRVILSSQLEHMGNAVTFSVSSLPRGDNVQGRVNYVEVGPSGEGTGRWEGRPDCLVVEGDTAWIGGEIGDKYESEATGRFALRVTDGGAREEAMGDVLEIAFGPNTRGDCTDWSLDDLTNLDLGRGTADVQASTD